MIGGKSERKSAGVEATDTVIIDGSQSGLAVSYYLTQANHSHIVLERDCIGSSWISNRWDSFTLVTPNWMNCLPGFPWQGSNPDGFLTRDEIVAYLQAYAASFNAHIVKGLKATRLSRTDDGYHVQTTIGDIHTRNVVVCTGYFHEPKLPAYADCIDDSIVQVHSCHYRSRTGSRPAACWSSDRGNREHRSPRSCIRRAGERSSRSALPYANPGLIVGRTPTTGSISWVASTDLQKIPSTPRNATGPIRTAAARMAGTH